MSHCLCVFSGWGGPCGSGSELHVRSAGERDESAGAESTYNKLALLQQTPPGFSCMEGYMMDLLIRISFTEV